MTDGEAIERHQRASDGFAAVAHAGARWDAPSPCTDWDTRGVIEHVIGFHEVLLLRPLGVKAHRPREGPAERWDATAAALFAALAAAEPQSILPTLTTDVLVHTWDLAKAFGMDVELDAELCERALAAALPREEQLRQSDMFGPRVAVPEQATVQAQLLGVFGRDPDWQPSP